MSATKSILNQLRERIHPRTVVHAGTDLANPPPLPPPPGSEPCNPTFFRALRGIWLFTWKPQLTARRLLLGALILLILPLLIFITILPADAWARYHSLLGNAVGMVNRLSRTMARERVPLKTDQKAELTKIFADEFARAESSWADALFSTVAINRQKDEIRFCYRRIRNRAQTILDERQFKSFQAFEQRRVKEAQARASQPQWSRSGAFYHWIIDLYFFVLLPLNCVRVCGPLIRDELQADTLGFLTTRPLSRAKLIIAKYLAQTTWLQLLLLIETLLVFGAGQLRHIAGVAELLPLFLVVQFLAVLAWSALGAFFGQVTNRYMALALLYGLIVEMGIGRIPTNINTLSLMRHLKSLLAQSDTLQGVYSWSLTAVPLSIAALLLAAALFLALAAFLFTWKEYHHKSEMQK